MNSIKLAPSILAADFARLGQDVTAAVEAGAEYIHVDVMDGRFVPNISIGVPVVAALRPFADQLRFVLDVHLMIEDPDRYLEAFAAAGADQLTVHVEACTHLHRTIQVIKGLNCRVGVALNPATPLVMLDEVLPLVDCALIMTVNPGFGGQTYIPSSTDKVARLRQRIKDLGLGAEIQVDGGINRQTIGDVATAGATILVAGSAVFGNRDVGGIAANMQVLRQLVQ